MSYQSIFILFYALIFLISMNYVSSELEINRNEVIEEINKRRDSIRYVISVLDRLYNDLATTENEIKRKRVVCMNDGDCDVGLGPVSHLPYNKPGQKRSLKCKLLGIDCYSDSVKRTEFFRRKRQLSYSTESDDTTPSREQSDILESDCMSDEPGADCENNGMGDEADSQSWLKKGNRNPGK